MQKIKGFNVRKATHDDIFQIMVLIYNFSKELPELYRSFNRDKVERSVSNFIDSDFSEIFVLEDDGVIIGMLACMVVEFLFSQKKTATELAWYIDKDHRGGTKSIRLIKSYEEWARKKGADLICMADVPEIQDLGGLYKRLGYQLNESTYAKEA
jgi:N-acetylglutamate synthase and related acetyltransferases